MADTTAEAFDTDVLVIGAGPTGAATALTLATHGVRVQFVTHYPWLSHTPRAHITNQRTMEALRDLGVADDVARYGSPWNVMGDTLFTTSLAGEEIARIRTWGTGDERYGDYLAASPCGMLDVAQPHMEAVLVKHAAARGADLVLSTEYVSHVQDADGVTTTLRDKLSGREYVVRSRYLVGADGGRSRVAADLGLPFEGQAARATTAYVQFTADLRRFVEHRPSILYWIMTPSANYGEIGMGLLRAVRPWDSWIAGWGYDADQGEPDFSTAAVTAKIRTLVGDPSLDVSIDATSTWQVNQLYATSYGSGRVFCGGDAVHRHPPSGGLGSNTCIQDAFNLAWKLAYVIKGHAGSALLDSYSDERAPVGAHVVLRANKSRVEFGPLNAAIATEGAADPVAAALAKVRDPGPDGVAVRDDLVAALRLKNYEFNAHGVESNQRYVSTAVVPDVSAAPEVFARDPELYAQPSTRPGAKLPHAWLVDTAGRRVSTLDVVGGGDFVLVTGLAGTAWRTAVASLDLPFLRVVVIGDDGARDLYGTWHGLREVHEAGALLVRPDGYIAWRHPDPVDDDTARDLLGRALEACLSRTTSPHERESR